MIDGMRWAPVLASDVFSDALETSRTTEASDEELLDGRAALPSYHAVSTSAWAMTRWRWSTPVSGPRPRPSGRSTPRHADHVRATPTRRPR